MNSKSLRQISSLAFSTTGSRILGLVRDATFFSYFGTSLFGSAFIIAFTIPNLFRRLLGEGALSSAFLPVFSKCWSDNHDDGFKLLNQTLTRLLLYFGGAVICAATVLLLFHQKLDLGEKWEKTLPMLALLLPYAVLICLAAIVTAALNAVGKFFLASLSPILLNLAMIGALIIGGYFWQSESLQLAYALSIGVLIGGLLQFALPTVQMLRNQWKPTWDLGNSDDFSKVRQLFVTATGGAAVLQINVLVTRLIAYQHSDAAVSQLYLASRLTELPLGVFAVAVYTVLFPLLAKYAASQEDRAFSDTCTKGIVMILGITLPAAAGLAFLAQPILSLLFEWGRFSASDVISASPVLSIYALSIPFYALISFLTRVFHSQQDMKSPMNASLVALFLNAGLSIGLMIPYGVNGLASAGVITSACQLCMLCTQLVKKPWIRKIRGLWVPVTKITLATAVMSLIVCLCEKVFPFHPDMDRTQALLKALVYLASGVLSYILSVLLLGLRSSFEKPDRINPRC